MRHYIVLVLLFLCVTASAQFRMVGSADEAWAVDNDSTYTVPITFQSDLTGFGYLATQISTGYRLFTPTEQIYRVASVSVPSFNTATLTVVEYGGTDGVPSGQLMCYNPNSKRSIPQVPVGSTGATSQMGAAINSYNSNLIGEVDTRVDTIQAELPTPKQLEYHSGTTDGSGIYQVTFNEVFSTTPYVSVTPTGLATNQFYRVTALSATGCTVHVFERELVTVLTVELLAFAVTDVSGALINIQAIEK